MEHQINFVNQLVLSRNNHFVDATLKDWPAGNKKSMLYTYPINAPLNCVAGASFGSDPPNY